MAPLCMYMILYQLMNHYRIDHLCIFVCSVSTYSTEEDIKLKRLNVYTDFVFLDFELMIVRISFLSILYDHCASYTDLCSLETCCTLLGYFLFLLSIIIIIIICSINQVVI